MEFSQHSLVLYFVLFSVVSSHHTGLASSLHQFLEWDFERVHRHTIKQ